MALAAASGGLSTTVSGLTAPAPAFSVDVDAHAAKRPAPSPHDDLSRLEAGATQISTLRFEWW